MAETLIAEFDCGPRTVKKYRNGRIVLSGGVEQLSNEAAIAKLGEYVLASLLSDEQIAELLVVFPEYQVGKSYAADELFQYENKLYKVLQAHTSQADWVPDTTAALYTLATPEGVIPVWVQPTGAHDAYQKGAQVEYPAGSGTIWTSTIDANVWQPGVYGWVQA